jgi:hypothetical protein
MYEEKTMKNNSLPEQEMRRITILKGISDGLTRSQIAEKLCVRPCVVTKDLTRMKRKRDSKLIQAYITAQKLFQAKKLLRANRHDDRFHQMTGMTLKEKTFENMMSYYKPELLKIINSNDECAAIRGLSDSVRKTLNNNGILLKGWKKPVITIRARTYLNRTSLINSG